MYSKCRIIARMFSWLFGCLLAGWLGRQVGVYFSTGAPNKLSGAWVEQVKVKFGYLNASTAATTGHSVGWDSCFWASLELDQRDDLQPFFELRGIFQP